MSTELLINFSALQEGSYKKIQTSIYYHNQSSTFYRLSFLPHTVSQPRFAALTQYNPFFLLINRLLKKNILFKELEEELKHLTIDVLADRKINGVEEMFIANKGKIYDYLETRVQRLEECLSTKLGQKTLEVDSTIKEEKSIREETILILKSEINDKAFVDAFAKERYNYEKILKLMPYMEDPEETVIKKKAPPKKQPIKEERKIEHGQKTLFGFMKSK